MLPSTNTFSKCVITFQPSDVLLWGTHWLLSHWLLSRYEIFLTVAILTIYASEWALHGVFGFVFDLNVGFGVACGTSLLIPFQPSRDPFHSCVVQEIGCHTLYLDSYIKNFIIYDTTIMMSKIYLSRLLRRPMKRYSEAISNQKFSSMTFMFSINVPFDLQS